LLSSLVKNSQQSIILSNSGIKKMTNRQQRVILSGATLLILGFCFGSLITLLPKPEIVTAKEVQPKKVARTNSWQAASFPVENFQAYTSGFGYRPSATGGSNWEFHGGLDMAAPQGSYIRNWWVGTVIKVRAGEACGTHVVIKSGEWEHTYCHMEGNVETASGRRYFIDRAGGILIWEGQQIPTGARIGRVGMTGRTTGPHLHWGLKYSNNYVDPALVLQAMFSQQKVSRTRS
jgi:murein DD-endopeptidase MepM/ murein hydrolase activator NlpD